MNLEFIEIILSYQNEGQLKWNIGTREEAQDLFQKINQGNERAKYKLVAHVIKHLCALLQSDEDIFLEYYNFVKEHGLEKEELK